MDFVSFWKTASVALTGTFGMVGLLSDFRTEDKKAITAWGWTSLVGILVSSIGGMVAQAEETNDDAKRTTQGLARAEATLQNTQAMVQSMNRSMAALVGATVDVDYSLDCTLRASAPCGTAEAEQTLLARSNLEFLFFADASRADRFTGGAIYPNDADLTWSLRRDTSHDQEGNFGGGGTATSLTVRIDAYQAVPSPISPATNRILSLVDLAGATVVVFGGNNELEDLPILDVTIRIKDGRSIVGGPFEKIVVPPMRGVGGSRFTAYRFTFPKAT